MQFNEIFSYTRIDHNVIYRHCELLIDFEPFHKGDKFSAITIRFCEIIFEKYDETTTKIDIEIRTKKRVIPQIRNQSVENLQDTLTRLSLDNHVSDFQKTLEILDIPSQLSKLIKLLKASAIKGNNYTTFETLPIENIECIGNTEYPKLADYLAEYLSNILQIGVYYYDDVWVFYWNDISECGDSLPYPEISKDELDLELQDIENNIRMFRSN